jgi:hypothetical protein
MNRHNAGPGCFEPEKNRTWGIFARTAILSREKEKTWTRVLLI